MIQLKNYQQDTLDTLALYFDKVSATFDPKKAFQDTIYERFDGDDSRRYLPIKGFNPVMPYVCLRVPTGGGKTIIACNSIQIAKERLLKQEHAVVLWLVPSNAIRKQTIEALKNRGHPYRQALSSSLGEIEVRDITECRDISKGTLDGATTVIVSTLASFRVSDKDGRKIYDVNGSLMSHFSGLAPSILDKLEKDPDTGLVKYSLANVIKMRHPIVIVDEAHNARTPLSFDVLAGFSPSAIIEFTATPATGKTSDKTASNVLHHVSARELQAENMIKLPVRLEINANWKELLAHAIAERNGLEQIATLEGLKTDEYIRPIMLIKAQNREAARPENVTVDVAKKYLIEECHIPENQIAIEAYEKSETSGEDLFSDACPIRYIITVDKLGEGWDCSFAYVLCSLAEQFSATAVEQIIGRVLRLPHVSPKENVALNSAYVYTVSRNFADAAKSLKDALVDSGFNAMEANDFVLPASQSTMNFETPAPKKAVVLTGEFDKSKVSPSVLEKTHYDEENNTLTITSVLSQKEAEEIEAATISKEDKKKVSEAVDAHRKDAEAIFTSPADRNESFRVPQLGVMIQGEFVLLEKGTAFLEHNWNICDFKDAKENFTFNPKSVKAESGEVKLDKDGKLIISLIEEVQRDLVLINENEIWTESQLVAWLDRNIHHLDITPKDAVAFITHVLLESMKLHNATLSNFVRERYAFVKKLRELFDIHRKASSEKFFAQQLELCIKDKSLELGAGNNSINFNANIYPARYVCSPVIPFKKHYFKDVGDLKNEGEEFECAQFIDGLEYVDFWIRNLERSEASFWLPTAKGRFYPDFVLKLKDGRIFVIEYKGDNLVSNEDSKTKKIIGNLWAERSKGKCLFLMAEYATYKTLIPEMIKETKKNG